MMEFKTIKDLEAKNEWGKAKVLEDVVKVIDVKIIEETITHRNHRVVALLNELIARIEG